MKKALALLAYIFLCAKALAGCSLQTPSVDDKTMEESEEVVEHIGNLTFIKIDKILYYDKDTKIVFLWNGYCHNSVLGISNYDTVPVPYPSEDGSLFRYNEETRQIEKVDGR